MGKSIQTGIPPVKVGDELQLVIEGKGTRGDPFGKYQGYIIFVKGEGADQLTDADAPDVKITRADPKIGYAGLV
jgi:predicted RNA-binding protein with TRAM domain